MWIFLGCIPCADWIASTNEQYHRLVALLGPGGAAAAFDRLCRRLAGTAYVGFDDFCCWVGTVAVAADAGGGQRPRAGGASVVSIGAHSAHPCVCVILPQS